MKNLIKYIGSKNINFDILLDKYKNINTYCEPFSGSFYTGFLTAEKYKDIRYIYNDLDYSIYNFWICAKNNIFDLYDKINELYSDIEKYDELDDQLFILSEKSKLNDANTNAAITYIMQSCRKFRERTITTIVKDKEIEAFELISYINLLKNIEFYNKSYDEIIRQFDSQNTLFLIDPPYYIKNVDNYYKSDCRFIHHRSISNVIKNIKGKFILTYNICDYIKGLYSDFSQVEINKNYYTKDLVIHNTSLTDKEIYKIYNYIESI